ncbi:ATP-binding protein [Candidatus Ruminimicrobium bovinum]|uniref:ATP-binding protein n=1 Tax=Candidatus Ruminimicrobium bovinum TaxID=3242779 RepID=UPI0039B89C6E
MQKKIYKIRPYARLITMLGEQLIKNEIIALSELIKNSYDADASWVKVSFCNFNKDFSINKNSKIIIQDNGTGMNQDIIEKAWLNPATPTKLKQKNKIGKTLKGRILQGEKGIGRFAIFKLGSKIKISTKTELDNYENILTYDFSKYDSNFLTENNVEKELYLDDLEINYEQKKVENFLNNKTINFGINKLNLDPFGTIIEISNLKNDWSKEKIEKVQKEIGKMLPIFRPLKDFDFDVKFYQDDNKMTINEEYIERLRGLLERKPVFRIEKGYYDEQKQIISYEINSHHKELSFKDPLFNSLSYFRKNLSEKNITKCGNFEFELYIFDFNADENTKYFLSKDEKDDIKPHRIYLYRDNVRVLPYGDVDDDWLKIDMLRGTIRAAEFVSNEQVVGCVYITDEKNKNLKDKTNREGLIDDGIALNEFISILQCILRYIRANDFQKYLIDKNRIKEEKLIKEERPEIFLKKLEERFKNDKEITKLINSCSNAYKKEKQILNRRIEQVEDLAAVGLSVETASHDIMLVLAEVYKTLSDLYKDIKKNANIEINTLKNSLTELITNVGFIKDTMKDVQILFPSTKYRAKDVNVKKIVDKIYQMYKKTLLENKISVNIYSSSNNILLAWTRDAVLFQTFINLFDNAIFWLKDKEGTRKIDIEIDGDSKKLIFADSGYGIKDEIKNYIFEPFFSTKGDEGRGLGLYIAKQLLERYDYSIRLAETKQESILDGANFVLDFSKDGKTL